MDFIYKLFKKDSKNRDDIITVTSGLGIGVNVILALIKVVIGLLVSSIAIISEGVNNATDALSSVLTYLGAKLAKKKPNEKHPFGYGRIEYLTSLVVSLIILIAGLETLITSIKLIFAPEELKVSYVSLILVFVFAVIKFFMGIFTIKQGKNANSSALEAVGLECRNDAFASVITLISALIFLIFKLNLDAYAGIVISAFILKAGTEVFFNTISDILGRKGEKELADKIYDKVRKTDCVIAAADMMLHNYGPDKWSGSVNVEIDHKKTVAEVYEIIHKLQLDIMHEDNVTMVFGIYAVDNENAESVKLRSYIADFIKHNYHVKSYHAVYIDKAENKIYCDFIVDYNQRDWEKLEERFKYYMKDEYPDYSVELTIETEFV